MQNIGAIIYNYRPCFNTYFSITFALMNLNQLLMHWQSIIFIILCVVVFIQLFYYLFFFSRLASYKPGEGQYIQKNPVSVIICARDEAANLAKNLPGALVQKYPVNHEVIVVDDNSFDDSRYLLEEFEKTFQQLHVIELKQEAKMITGKKFPLSIGIKTAKHEIVLLTDADCVPATENWIEGMQQTYDDGTEIVLGYGAYNKKKGFLNKLVRWETFHTALQYFTYALAGVPYMGVGRNLSYKKTIFFRHKGFSTHNNVPSGDDDLFVNIAANKFNTKINIDPETFTLSEPVNTWAKWIKQKNRHYTTGKYYKPLHKFLLGLYSFTHFVFFPLLVISCIVFSWKLGLLVFAFRFIIQSIVFYPAMKKLQEQDLYRWLLFFDLWMFFHYLIFSVALIKKPKQAWN
jgi:glycosyltransferase involved in cell wall biosynthesis